MALPVQDLGLYSLYDSAKELYSEPAVSISDPAMVRQYKRGLEAEKIIQDFTLFKLGTFSLTDGTISLYSKPKVVSWSAWSNPEARMQDVPVSQMEQEIGR